MLSGVGIPLEEGIALEVEDEALRLDGPCEEATVLSVGETLGIIKDAEDLSEDDLCPVDVALDFDSVATVELADSVVVRATVAVLAEKVCRLVWIP